MATQTIRQLAEVVEHEPDAEQENTDDALVAKLMLATEGLGGIRTGNLPPEVGRRLAKSYDAATGQPGVLKRASGHQRAEIRHFNRLPVRSAAS